MASEVMAWVVVNGGGHSLVSTLAPTRVDAIKRMVGPEPDWRIRWRHWYRKYDCRACKVSVRLVRDGDSGEG